MVFVNLKEWAKTQGISESTARNWYREGKLPVPAKKVGGLILVEDTSTYAAPLSKSRTVVYARVSSSDQRSDLDRQVSRVTEWCTRQGWSVDDVVTEVGSALNGHRRKFLSLLRDPSATRIVVEHRDRFSRFGTEYIHAALESTGRELVVVDPAEVDDDLVLDMTELLTSMCARLYGKRAASDRAKRAIEASAHTDD